MTSNANNMIKEKENPKTRKQPKITCGTWFKLSDFELNIIKRAQMHNVNLCAGQQKQQQHQSDWTI